MPAFGGLTIRARWPLPIGLTMLIEPLAEVLRVVLEVDQLVRVDRGQVAEDGPATGGLGVDAVDRVDAEHAPVLLGLARGADRAADAVADPEAEAADLAGADVDVVRAGQEAVAAHEAEALVDDVEDAGRVGVPGALGLALEDPLDEVVLALLGAGLELEIAADGAELRDAHLAEIGDVEVVPLAGGLELLLLLVLRDGGAALDLAAPPRTAIARTLVWTELGHGLGGSLRRDDGPRPGWISRGIDPLRRPVWDAGIICSADGSVNGTTTIPQGFRGLAARPRDVDIAGAAIRMLAGCPKPSSAIERRPSPTRSASSGGRSSTAIALGAPAVNRLADRVCLVTGSTGIGAASARRFAAEGGRVFVVSRTADHVRALVDEIAGERAARSTASSRT